MVIDKYVVHRYSEQMRQYPFAHHQIAVSLEKRYCNFMHDRTMTVFPFVSSGRIEQSRPGFA